MSVLDHIVEDAKVLVRSRKAAIPVSHLESAPGFHWKPRSLEAALRVEGLSVIAEIKKASPSKGILRPDFDPVGCAKAYEEAGAAAISVLTEPCHFQGRLDDLSEVREVTDLPLLRKDFIVDVYQLFEARAFGADAVLLIVAVLDRPHLHDLLQAAEALDLAVLVEVFDPRELDRIDFDAVRVLGVNNRDLRTFEVDVDHSVRVFAHVPESVVRVSESGLSSASELKYLRDHGVDAVLMGETFMRAEDPGKALSALKDAMDGNEA